MIDTEGYEIRRLPWWWSPLTQKQVHFDAYSMLSYWRWMVEADVIGFLQERGFVGEEYLLLEGEFDRGELEEREALFRVDSTTPTSIRRYPLNIERIPEFYTPTLLEEEVLTTYAIIEKLEYMSIILTFSIETDVGHEAPFFAEVTCDTTIQATADRAEVEMRVSNAILKLFFCVFDADKVVKTAKKEKDPDWLIRYKYYLQKWAKTIYEREPTAVYVPERGERIRRGMDDFLGLLMDRIERAIATEGVEYFITREAFIAIGVEYGTADFEYEYPVVHVIIEKTRPTRYAIERTLVVAPTTSIRLDRVLDMEIVYTEVLE